MPPPELSDVDDPKKTLNSLAWLQGGEMITAPDELTPDDDNSFAFSPDQLVDVGDSRSFLLPGDLVELR